MMLHTICLLDDFKRTGRVMHNGRTYFLVFLIEEIFLKNSISWVR